VTIKVLLVGGFLGAGKTTLLLAAAKELMARGLRVGLVTNDQGADLVDTALATARQVPVTEVVGGCFCCRFPDLMASMEHLRATVEPQVILAEPVGSCTDLMATVLRPLSRYYAGDYEVGPLTVLVDAQRNTEAFTETVTYLYGKQLAEAEVLALNKVDLLTPQERERWLAQLHQQHPGIELFSLSARTGEGLAAWLDSVLSKPSRLAQPLEIDYQRYAEAEAEMGWLNLKAAVRAGRPFSAGDWLVAMMQTLAQQLAAQEAAIAHVKAQVVAPEVELKASLTDADKPLYWDMWSPHSETARAQLILNARVQTDPPALARAVRRALEDVRPQPDFRVDIVHFQCFRPAPPQPTHRMAIENN
jgi:G3E family GTPase